MGTKGLSTFQIIIFTVCGLGIILGVLIFSGKIPLGQSSTATTALTGSITIWGTLPGDPVRAMTGAVQQANQGLAINYVQKSAATFQSDLVNALASGVGPDMIFITPADVIKNKDRLFEIPYASFPQATFQSAFVDQGNLFLTSTGVLAFPFTVDPMVMYYNRDLLAGSFTLEPPKTWDDVVALNKKVTQKDDAGLLTTETAALGSFDNVTNAKDILTAMIFQTGNKIVRWEPTLKKYVSSFADGDATSGSGVANALGFFTAFANVNDADHYSWNGTLPNDKDQFVAGKLALYFGYASELDGIRQQNPNLNFEVAMFPQRATATVKATASKMWGLAIMKVSKNANLAIALAPQLVGKTAIAAYQSASPTPIIPARRDMLVPDPTDAHQTLFYNSAIIGQGLLDPDSDQTTALFKKYVDQINAGAAQPAAILSPGNSFMTSILSAAQPTASLAQ